MVTHVHGGEHGKDEEADPEFVAAREQFRIGTHEQRKRLPMAELVVAPLLEPPEDRMETQLRMTFGLAKDRDIARVADLFRKIGRVEDEFWPEVRIFLRAGQEAPFFSPLSPTSLASTAYPGLATSGNIWAWTPQVYVERRVAEPNETTLSIRAGVLDSLTGELPAGEYSRLATAGERSRLPASAVRLGVRHAADERVTSAGIGAYFARQNWGFNRTVNAWATTADWELPLSAHVQLSGEAYAGRAIGGLGGGAHSSVLFDGAPGVASSVVFPLASVGGWGQMKLKANARTEMNAAYGIDSSKPRGSMGLLQAPNDATPSASRNASDMFNVIYQLRSNVFLSVEYRRLWTTRFDGRSWLADHINLAGGIVF